MKKTLIVCLVLSLVFIIGTVSAESWICEKCQTENNDLYCGECGTKKPSKEWACQICGNTNTTNFCTHCGNSKTQEVIKKEPSIGVSAEYTNTTLHGPDGCYLDSVESEGPARKAGIRAGDIITKIDNKQVFSRADLNKLLKTYNIGDLVNIEIWRPDKVTDASKCEISQTGEFINNIEVQIEAKSEPTPTPTANPTKEPATKANQPIIDNSTIKQLIKSCPSIGKATQNTKDMYSSISDYDRDFPNQDGIHTWKILIQTGIYAFMDEKTATTLLVVPKGSASQLKPVMKWEIKLLESISSISKAAKQNGIRLIIEKRVDGGDYARYADKNGVIDLTIQTKLDGVLETMHSNLGLMEVIYPFKLLGELDTNGNGEIDFDELFN